MGWIETPEDDWMGDQIEDEKHTLLCEVYMKMCASGKFEKGWKHVWDLAYAAKDGTDEFEHMRELLQLSDLHVAALIDDDDVLRDVVLENIQYRREMAYEG